MTLPAVVMAAGLGSRLRPLTERHPKPVLPIDGRPVLASLLRELATARCPLVTIVVGHLGGQIQRLAGDGALWGVPVRYARQEQPAGSADAVLSACAAPPYLVLAADTLFTPGDIGRFTQAFLAGGAVGAVAVRRSPVAASGRHVVRLRHGRVERMQDDDPASPFTGAPLWAIAEPLARRLATRPGNAPWELQTAFQVAIDEGDEVAGIEIGPTRDLTAPLDLLQENFPYLQSL